jgi:hypothetical protein
MIAIAGALLGLLAILGFQNRPPDQAFPKAVQRISSRNSLLYFKGFSMTQHTGDQVVKIQADEFKVAPKKFKMFNFRPFNEMVLKNPRITTYRRKGESEAAESGSASDLQGFSFPKIAPPTNSFNPNSIKMVSGVRLDGLQWLIMKDEKESVKCQAKQAYLNLKKSEIELEDLELENLENGRRIAAKKGWLDLKANLVKIPKSSVTLAYAISISSHTIQLDMNLNQIPL